MTLKKKSVVGQRAGEKVIFNSHPVLETNTHFILGTIGLILMIKCCRGATITHLRLSLLHNHSDFDLVKQR
jgi:hypothetical protein